MISNKNKTIRAAAAVFLTGSLLFTVSCSKNQQAEDGYLLADPDGSDYSYSYPEEWNVLRSDSMFAVESPDKKANISSSSYELPLDKYDLSVYAESEDPYSDLLDDYINLEETGYIAQLRANFGDNIIFSEENIVDISVDEGKRSGKKLIYHMKVGDDEFYFETALILLPVDRNSCYLYDLTYTALGEEAYETHKAVFEKAVESFTFKELF